MSVCMCKGNKRKGGLSRGSWSALLSQQAASDALEKEEGLPDFHRCVCVCACVRACVHACACVCVLACKIPCMRKSIYTLVQLVDVVAGGAWTHWLAMHNTTHMC